MSEVSTNLKISMPTSRKEIIRTKRKEQTVHIRDSKRGVERREEKKITICVKGVRLGRSFRYVH